MDCYYSDSGCADYEVSPRLIPPCCDCCHDELPCYPQLPVCDIKSPKVMYCTEKKPPKVMYCCEAKPPKIVYCVEKPPCKPTYHKPEHDCCTPKYECRPRSSPSPSPCRKPVCCPDSDPCCKPVKTKYIIPCYRYEDGRIERYVPTRYGKLPKSAYSRNGMQDQIHGYRGAIRYICTANHPYYGNCVHTVVEPMRKVRKLPVTAFKRNGMQDQEHSKLLGTANFLVRCPRDVAIECDACVNPVKVADPAKVPPCCKSPAARCGFMRKKPVEKNQPTVLMRRACEVACGTRRRRKPFVSSSYIADPDHEVRRFHAEDERGNCCFHFERKKPVCCDCCEPKHICNPCVPTGTCVSSPGCEYVSSLVADRGSGGLSCCYYCR